MHMQLVLAASFAPNLYLFIKITHCNASINYYGFAGDAVPVGMLHYRILF